jgi:hypothetical protein
MDSLRYDVRDESGWSTETAYELDILLHDSFYGADLEIAVDADDEPHVAFLAPSGDLQVMMYSSRSGGRWSTAAVDEGRDCLPETALALGPDGTPWIAYADGATGELLLATGPGGGWNIEAVPTSETVTRGIDLAVDRRGHWHITYWSEASSEVLYLRETDEGVEEHMVDTMARSTHYTHDTPVTTALSVDGRGLAHILYGALDLHYAAASKSGG